MPNVLIIGAGLAGLTAALELSGRGRKVTVLEKKDLPRHKVCGEYLSREVLPYFEKAGVDLPERSIVDQFLLSTASGKHLQSKLPLGGIGISRKTLDLKLFEKAADNGADIQFYTKVQHVDYNDDQFRITTSQGTEYKADVVLATHGKGPGWQSFSDIRNPKRPVFLGAKQYYRYKMDDNLVVLHNFHGGYCGAVKVEDGTIDVAYMVQQDVFREFKNTALMEKQLLHANPFLRELMTMGEEVLENPMTISNFQLGPRKLVNDHVLYAGDAAAMIPPACGNGMAMAIWGGLHAAGSIEQFLLGKFNRGEMENHYVKLWKRHLGSRLFWGRQFQRLMGTGLPAELAMRSLQLIPGILPYLVRLTHSQSPQQFDV